MSCFPDACIPRHARALHRAHRLPDRAGRAPARLRHHRATSGRRAAGRGRPPGRRMRALGQPDRDDPDLPRPDRPAAHRFHPGDPHAARRNRSVTPVARRSHRRRRVGRDDERGRRTRCTGAHRTPAHAPLAGAAGHRLRDGGRGRRLPVAAALAGHGDGRVGGSGHRGAESAGRRPAAAARAAGSAGGDAGGDGRGTGRELHRPDQPQYRDHRRGDRAAARSPVLRASPGRSPPSSSSPSARC